MAEAHEAHEQGCGMRIKARVRPPPPSLRHHTPLLSNISRSASLPADKAHVCSYVLTFSWRDAPGWTIDLRKLCPRAHLSALSAVHLTRGGGEPALEVLRTCCSGSLDGSVFSGAVARYVIGFQKALCMFADAKSFLSNLMSPGLFPRLWSSCPQAHHPCRVVER
jgi:hypothetical protein